MPTHFSLAPLHPPRHQVSGGSPLRVDAAVLLVTELDGMTSAAPKTWVGSSVGASVLIGDVVGSLVGLTVGGFVGGPTQVLNLYSNLYPQHSSLNLNRSSSGFDQAGCLPSFIHVPLSQLAM